MNEKRRIYYYFIFGAGGGATGWFLAATLLQSKNAAPTLGQQALYGAMLGALIGAAIAAYEGLTSRSLIRFIKFGGIGLLLGTLAGVIALPAAQGLYSALLGPGARVAAAAAPRAGAAWQPILIGTLCWLLFGGLIGFGESLLKGSQSFKGLAGGVLGGLIGGGVYEIARASGVTETASFEQQRVLAITLAVLGGAIGSSVAFVTTALKRAWFEVVDGKFAGKIYDVTKYVDRTLGSHKSGIIGSDEWGASVYLPPDREVLPRHARIGYANGAPTLTFYPEAEPLQSSLVNGRKVTNWQLKDGDRLQVGSTTLIYRHKRK
jgi:hypothetical protein